MRHLTARERTRATAGNLRSTNTCCIVRDMGKSSKKSINSSSNRPARRARRGAAAAGENVADLAPAAAAAPADDVTPAVGEPAPVTAAAPASALPRHEVQQLAFHYYAESGYVQGKALDHWLRAESELGNS